MGQRQASSVPAESFSDTRVSEEATMTIILYTGEFIIANKIEFSSDGKSLILDDTELIAIYEVVRIVR